MAPHTTPTRADSPVVRDKAVAARAARVEKALKKVRDRRRFKITPVPTGDTKTLVKKVTGTIHTGYVRRVEQSDVVLKDGALNSKIGGDVFVGRLKGAKILTLTLEERKTCPTHCALWQSCYGNGMPRSTRWEVTPSLFYKLADELVDHCRGDALVLVRLHVLGDFPSVAYVKFWRQMLKILPTLHVFGFTAWRPSEPIGRAVVRLRDKYPDRFMIRTSGFTGQWGSFTIDFPTEKKKLGDAIVCPEQIDAMNGHPQERHCANCAACWSCSNPIVFVEH